jgi:hypothetical protein
MHANDNKLTGKLFFKGFQLGQDIQTIYTAVCEKIKQDDFAQKIFFA